MDDKEIHYLSYDPDEMWRSMVLAYMDAGGDVLYPGDEKEIFLRGVQQMMIQAFAGVDNALRMDTLRYAMRDYLDLYGEKRNCYRLTALAATAEAEITFRATGIDRTIAAGTALTVDGDVLYLLAENVNQTPFAQTVTAKLICDKAGSLGNGLVSGMQMQFLTPQDAVVRVICTKSASGGQDAEDDETYRDRIRRFGLTAVTTGPKAQYESAAMSVTSEIIDARALNTGAGCVGIYLLLENEEGADAILASVLEALNAQSARPLTDKVEVHLADRIPYALHIQVAREPEANITDAVAAAATEYQNWQDKTIGRAFNPDRLMAMLYQAGATRVIFTDESHLDGRSAAYTEIPENAHCSGTISLAVIDG